MVWIRKGYVSVASDTTTAALIRNTTSQTHAALRAMVGVVVADQLEEADPDFFREPAEAAVAAMAAELRPAKCAHREGGEWVRDDADGPLATHYLIPDHTGAYVARPTVWPVPAANASFDW